MAEFDILPDDIKLYILSCINIQELDIDFSYVSKEWNNLIRKLLITHYTSYTKQDFNAAFAISVMQNNVRVFNILKHIAEDNNSKFIIKAHLFVRKPEYTHTLLCKKEVPEPHERQRGFYFYEQPADDKIYVLVIHSETINETLCVTDLLQAVNKLDLLKYIKFPIKKDEKSGKSTNKKLISVIKKSCAYSFGYQFEKQDVMSILADIESYEGQSLLYYAIKQGDFVLANYLLDCMEKYIKSKSTPIETSDTIDPVCKRQKFLQESDIYMQEKENILGDYVDIGYKKYGDIDISPLTALLLNFHLKDKAVSILAKRLLLLGGTVSIVDDYYRLNRYEKEGYRGENVLEDLLEAEMELRNDIHKEDQELLKQENMRLKQEIDRLTQDLEKTKYELTCAKEQIQRFENGCISDEALLNAPQTRKRKRDIENTSILTQFNNLTQFPNSVIDEQSKRLETEENNSPAVANLFKS